MRAVPLLLACVLAAASCNDQGASSRSSPASPALPALVLEPRLDELRAIASEAPAPPDERERAELAELVEASFSSMASPEVHQAAQAELLENGHRRFALEQGLRHAEALVRSHCAHHLGQLGDPTAVPALLWRVRQEVEAEPLCWIIDALAALGNRSALPRLQGLLADPLAQERATSIADVILADAGRVPQERTWDALRLALEELYREWLDRRLDPAPATPFDAALRARLAEQLTGLEEFQLRPVDEARTVLTNLSFVPEDLLRLALTAKETYLRVHTVEIVRDLGRAGAPLGSALLPLLGDPAARPYAVEALGETGYEPAYPFLVRFLEGDDLELSVAAASALGPLGVQSAIEPLSSVLADESVAMDVRVRAACSLALLSGDVLGGAFLRERLERGDYHEPTVRELLARVDEARTGGDWPGPGER